MAPVRWLAARPALLRRTMVAASLAYCAWSISAVVQRDIPGWILETYGQPTGPFLGGLTAFVGYSVATLFVHRKKRLVLFLRKFHNPEATALISATIEQHPSVIRLVTLDDGQFAPRGAPVATIAGTLVLTVVGAIIGLFSVLLVLAVYAEDFGQFYYLPTIVAVTCGLIIPSGGIGFVTFATGLFGAFSIWRTRKMKTSSMHEIAVVTRRLGRMKARIRASDALAPRACVVTSSDAVWRDAVSAVAAVAEVIVLDVSELSAAIEWELAFVSAEHPEKLLLVAREEARPDLADGTVRFPLDLRGLPDPASLIAALEDRLSRTALAE